MNTPEEDRYLQNLALQDEAKRRYFYIGDWTIESRVTLRSVYDKIEALAAVYGYDLVIRSGRQS